METININGVEFEYMEKSKYDKMNAREKAIVLDGSGSGS